VGLTVRLPADISDRYVTAVVRIEPILEADGTVIQDSTEIINFLEQTFPDPGLTPPDPTDARAAIDWEEYLDEEIGVTLRLWFCRIVIGP